MTQLKSKRNKQFSKKFIKYLYIVFVKDLEVASMECLGKVNNTVTVSKAVLGL